MIRKTAHGSLFSALSSPIQKIAVFRALYLGDLLCAIPALRALRCHFPEAVITLIGLPWAVDLVRRLPYLDHFLPFPGYPGITEVEYQPAQTQAFLAEARATGYDLALQMHGNGTNSNGFVADLTAQLSLGYRRDGDERLSLSLPYPPAEHEITRWLRLLTMIGVSAGDVCTEFPTSQGEALYAAALLRPVTDLHAGPIIGLHAGAKDPARRWPATRFAQLADALVDHHDARIVLTGSSGERAITAAIRQQMRAPVLDLTGKTDLGTFVEVIAQLDLLVTNDTGASHLAAARGTRSIVLFGPSRPERWAPLNQQRHRIIDALALVGHTANPRTVLQHLPVEPVFTTCVELLRYTHTGAGRLPACEVLCDD